MFNGDNKNVFLFCLPASKEIFTIFLLNSLASDDKNEKYKGLSIEKQPRV